MRFVVFAEDWASHPSSTQHLFAELAKHHEVHWVNSIGMRKPSLKLNDLKRVFNKLKQLFSESTSATIETPKAMHVYKLPVLPWHDNALVKRFNKWVYSQYFKNIYDEPVIYWLSVPTAEYLITKQKRDRLIYYCGDDFSALAGVDASLVTPFENSLIQNADLIYVISAFLMNKMPKHKTKMLSHGVSYDLFTSKSEIAPEISHLNGPIIGFYGSINAWLDIALLTALVAQRPSYQLVLVGDIVGPTAQLLQFKNVTHIPAIEHARLASFSTHWNVSVLPFVNNEQIRACDPLKLKEYLAAGKPIVATDFPAVKQYQTEILIGKTHDQFINKIDEAVSLNTIERNTLKLSQQQLAKNHSWESKALKVQQDLSILNHAV